jgi:predicted dithiol-disulfide oxidoreductase (DUF899 family)
MPVDRGLKSGGVARGTQRVSVVGGADARVARADARERDGAADHRAQCESNRHGSRQLRLRRVRFTTFVLDDDVVYHTHSTTARGVEFLMGYHPILDRVPKGRDEGEAWQLWIRRHDEYKSS